MKTKEDSGEKILKEHLKHNFSDDFLEKEYNHSKKDSGLSKETFIEPYTSPSSKCLYAPDLLSYRSKNFVCDENFDPLADGTTIFPDTGNPVQIFRDVDKEPINEWKKLFPSVIAQDTHSHYLVSISLLGSIKNVTTHAVISDEAFWHIAPSIDSHTHYREHKESISSIKDQLIRIITYSSILKATELVKKTEFTMKNINPDLQNQVIDLIIYIADKNMYKSAKELLKLFWATPRLKDSLDPSCSSKLDLCLPKIEKSFAIQEVTDLPPTEITIIGEYLSEISDNV